MANILAGFVLAAPFYMLLIDTVDLPELYAMLGVAALAAVAYAWSCDADGRATVIRPAWLLRSWRAVVSVPRHIALVSWEAGAQLLAPRQRRGRFRAVPFAGGQGGEDIGRFALAEGFGSLAPNTIVLGVDDERGLLLVHQLRPGGGRDELDVMRLG